MSNLVLKIFVHEGGKLPQRGKQGDAGIDVFARLPTDKPLEVQQFQVAKIPLGFSYSFWERLSGRDPFTSLEHNELIGPINDYYLEIENRSGVGTKSGFVPVAKIGDANYRGEIHYCVVKVSEHWYEVNNGDKIAQAIIHPFADPHRVEIVQVNSLDELGPSQRGAQGFGASGK